MAPEISSLLRWRMGCFSTRWKLERGLAGPLQKRGQGADGLLLGFSRGGDDLLHPPEFEHLEQADGGPQEKIGR